MKSLLVALVAIAVVAIAGAQAGASEKLLRVNGRNVDGPHELQQRPFRTPLDHFDPRNGEWLELTYVQNVDYYKPGGPIYIFVNDGGVFTTEFLQIGLMHDIAHDTGAAIVTADNRFFRSNLPTQNASTENLQLLTVEQSIGDVAYLIGAVRADLPGAHASKVILFGSGHGAALATWTKQKFPHLVAGVWSSSGIYRHEVHSSAFYDALSANIATVGGAECARTVNEAFIQISTLMVRRQSTRISSAFNTCFEVAYYNSFDVAAFFAGITQVLADYVNVHHATGIQNFCADLQQLQNSSEPDAQFEAYARWVRSVFTDEFCLDVSFFSRIEEAQEIDWDFIGQLAWNNTGVNLAYPSPSRPTLYWHCTQLGLHGTTANADTLFGHTIGQDAFFRFCQAVFGREYNFAHLAGAVELLRTQYGGQWPGIDGVVYTNGQLDAMRPFGVNDVRGVRSHVFNIANHGKSADLYSIQSTDATELRTVKQNIVELITEWSA